MATTTNYSFPTPDDTALVKDGASAIRSLGSAVDTTVKALNPETTTGAISYRGATANQKVALPIGTAGQVLAVNSGATAPEWATVSATPANATATVATSQGTTSTSFTDLTTSGPAVTVTTGTKALVIVTARATSASSTRHAEMSYAVSGASTVSAVSTFALRAVGGTTPNGNRMSAASIVTLTAGSNTFTSKYRTDDSAQTATFQDREIIVVNMGS